MLDRTRPIRKEICLNEQELNLIQHKMNQLGTRNFGAYARKMLIDGYFRLRRLRTACRPWPTAACGARILQTAPTLFGLRIWL